MFLLTSYKYSIDIDAELILIWFEGLIGEKKLERLSTYRVVELAKLVR
jgi:hypothetical protein